MKPAKAEKSVKLFSVRIPSQLHYRWKITAARHNVSMEHLTIEAMTTYLAKPRRTNGHARENA